MIRTIDVMIEYEGWTAPAGDYEALAARALDAAIVTLGPARAQLLDDTEVSLLLCDDASMRALNHQWRGQDRSTNVLSFPAVAAARHVSLGDIVVAYETCAREARERGVSLVDHLAHLLVHGVFHLLGFDHGDDREAECMEALETRALARLGVASPFAVGDSPDEGHTSGEASMARSP